MGRRRIEDEETQREPPKAVPAKLLVDTMKACLLVRRIVPLSLLSTMKDDEVRELYKEAFGK